MAPSHTTPVLLKYIRSKVGMHRAKRDGHKYKNNLFEVSYNGWLLYIFLYKDTLTDLNMFRLFFKSVNLFDGMTPDRPLF